MASIYKADDGEYRYIVLNIPIDGSRGTDRHTDTRKDVRYIDVHAQDKQIVFRTAGATRARDPGQTADINPNPRSSTGSLCRRILCASSTPYSVSCWAWSDGCLGERLIAQSRRPLVVDHGETGWRALRTNRRVGQTTQWPSLVVPCS